MPGVFIGRAIAAGVDATTPKGQGHDPEIMSCEVMTLHGFRDIEPQRYCCRDFDLLTDERWLRKKHREARLQAKMSQNSSQQNSRKGQKPAPARKDAAAAPPKSTTVEAR